MRTTDASPHDGRRARGWRSHHHRGGHRLPFCWQAPFVALPFGDPWCGVPLFGIGVALAWYDDPSGGFGAAAESASREAPPLQPKIIDAAAAVSDPELEVREAAAGIVRITRRDDGRPVREVVLFVADSLSRPIAAQTFREPPYSALFDLTPEVAYVGATIAYEDGVKTTTVIPYSRR